MESAETAARIDHLRQESQTRKLTKEEAAEALKLIRADRVSAAYASKTSKAKKEVVSPEATLNKLKALMGKNA